MKSLTLKQTIALILSGAVAGYAITHAVFLLSWVCYLPLFILLRNKNVKEYALFGAIFGFGVSIIFFFWMVEGAKEFSGNQLFYGILVTTISTVLFCVYWVGLMTIVGIGLKRSSKGIFLKAIFVASCFVLGESLLTLCFSQLPYYLFNSGDGLLDNLYTIQWAAYFGLPILNFMVVFVNYLTKQIIEAKKWKRLVMPLGIITSMMLSGFLIEQKIKQEVVSLKPIKIAIAAENVPPQLKWDEHGGNILAQRLLSLNKLAASFQPDIVFWSESTIPWTYKSNDELLTEILKEPYPQKTTHIIGFMSEYSATRVYNSAYGIMSNGKVVGRYDKQTLLQFIETPLFGLTMPFLDLDGFIIEKGVNETPITTAFGKAGIVICNEIVNQESTMSMSKNGAEFLLNPSNDAWFKNSYITEMHFLYARLSAIVNRKDVIINSNNGFSGHIKYTGEVLLKRKSTEFFVELVNVSPNRYDNVKFYFPLIVPLLCLFLALNSVLLPFFHLNIRR